MPSAIAMVLLLLFCGNTLTRGSPPTVSITPTQDLVISPSSELRPRETVIPLLDPAAEIFHSWPPPPPVFQETFKDSEVLLSLYSSVVLDPSYRHYFYVQASVGIRFMVLYSGTFGFGEKYGPGIITRGRPKEVMVMVDVQAPTRVTTNVRFQQEGADGVLMVYREPLAAGMSPIRNDFLRDLDYPFGIPLFGAPLAQPPAGDQRGGTTSRWALWRGRSGRARRPGGQEQGSLPTQEGELRDPLLDPDQPRGSQW